MNEKMAKLLGRAMKIVAVVLVPICLCVLSILTYQINERDSRREEEAYKKENTPQLGFESVEFIKYSPNEETPTHHRYVGDLEIKDMSLGGAIIPEKLSDVQKKEVLDNKNSIYFSEGQGVTSVVANFLSDENYIVYDKYTTKVTLINLGATFKEIRINGLGITYADSNIKRAPLKGNKVPHYEIVKKNEKLEFYLDEVTNSLNNSICSISADYYTNLKSETNLLNMEFDPSLLQYTSLVIYCTITNMDGKEFNYAITIKKEDYGEDKGKMLPDIKLLEDNEIPDEYR